MINVDNRTRLNNIRAVRLLDSLIGEKRKDLGKIKLRGCAVCGDKGYLTVHHLNYKENRTMPLCPACHYRVHFGKGLGHLNPVGRRRKRDKLEITLGRMYEIRMPEIKREIRKIINEKDVVDGYRRIAKQILFGKKKSKTRIKGIVDVKGIKESKVEKVVNVYIDGFCIERVGMGGYGALLEYGEHRRLISGGFRKTEHNRLMLIAVVEALEVIKERCQVKIYSDTEFLNNIVSRICKFKKSEIRKSKYNKYREIDRDILDRLKELCEIHEVEFRLTAGLKGFLKNKTCMGVAIEAVDKPCLRIDSKYG